MRQLSKTLGLAAALAATATAHSTMTTFFINGENQGDGVCVRQPKDGNTSTSPIASLGSNDMACGRDGTTAAAFTCRAPQGADLTFWFREWPNFSEQGSIDPSHEGPGAVYMKQVSSMDDSAPGGGWFKIWGEGYDFEAKKWYTTKLIENQGFLTVTLPSGLPAGYYLIRTELLAYQNVPDKNDPQFYVECAQIYVEGTGTGTIQVPEGLEAQIPGYVSLGDPSVSIRLYEPVPEDYAPPGPSVYRPQSSGSTSSTSTKALAASDVQIEGAIPKECILVNGNWCGVEVPSYTDEGSCWDSSQNCWSQSKQCWDTAPPSGHLNCDVWDDYCTDIQNSCGSGDFSGPRNGGAQLARKDVEVPEGVDFTPESIATSSATVTTVAPSDYETQTLATPSATAAASSDFVATTDTSEPAVTSSVSKDEKAGAKEEDGSNSIESGETNESSDLVISTDGRCGGITGQTCEGSQFGNCCSRRGKCTNSPRQCSCGCQGGFGKCSLRVL